MRDGLGRPGAARTWPRRVPPRAPAKSRGRRRRAGAPRLPAIERGDESTPRSGRQQGTHQERLGPTPEDPGRWSPARLAPRALGGVNSPQATLTVLGRRATTRRALTPTGASWTL